MRLSTLIACAGIAGSLAVFAAIGRAALDQHQRRYTDAEMGIGSSPSSWVPPDRPLTDEEVKRLCNSSTPPTNPIFCLPDVEPQKAEQEQQRQMDQLNREYLRKQRAIYECILRLASRMAGKDTALLERMCWEFPDLR